jgi:chitodextrinase
MKTKNVLLGLLLTGAMTICLQPLSAKTWYVNGATTTWQGKPADDVKATIAEAITAAGTDEAQIWIAAGTYDVSTAIVLGGKKISLYGGFAGTESSIDERAKVADGKAWEFTNPTVLSVSAVTNVISIGSAVGAPTVIDGFTMQGADNESNTKGVYANNAGNVTIRNCIVQGFGKTGTTDGGGMDIRGASSAVTVERCLVQNNRGKNGGGIYVAEGPNNLIKDCEILNNVSGTSGEETNNPARAAGTPSPSNWGGGVLLNNATITNCLVAGNAAYAGGGILVRSNTSKIINCIVVNNTATYGGGIGFDKRVTAGLVINSTVAGNTATDGGGVFLSDNGQGMYNTILWNNKKGDVVENVVAKLSDGTAKTPVLKSNISDADLSAYGAGNLIVADSAALFGEKWLTAATSPGKDAGTVEGITPPATDFAGRIRVKGAAIDIGPCEFPDPPAAPTSLELIPGVDNIIVRWTASAGVSGYNVYCGGVKQNAAGLVAGAEYTVTGLTLATAYAIAVEAVDADGVTSAQLSGSATTLSSADTEKPSQPASLAEVAITKTTLTVSYGSSTDNVGVLGYRIYANGVDKGTTTELRYTVAGLTPATGYAIEVKAYDAAGNESASSQLDVTTVAAHLPTVFYVKPGAGSTLWGNKKAYFVKNTIVAAMTSAKALREICEVWVATGEYLNISLALQDSISLYGGFAGTESALGERVVGSAPWSFTSATVLKGETPAYSSASSNTISSKSVIKQDIAAKHPLVVDGFTITNGEHGLLLLGGGNTTVSRCIITGNGQLPSSTSGIDGGGVAIRGASAKYRVSHCLIENNSAKSGGGVIIAEGSAGAVVEYCTIRSNKALTVNTASWSFEKDNTSSIHGWGGGVFNQNGVVISCLISGNEALAGGGIFVRSNASRISSCIVTDNSAIFGGGLTYDKRSGNVSAAKSIYNCLFANNRVSQNALCAQAGTVPDAESGLGGGVYFTAEGQAIYNSIFIGNTNAAESDSLSVRDGEAGKLESSYVDVEADTVGGNAYHPAAENLYEAGTWKPKDGFPGVDQGVAGNPDLRDYEGKVRLKGSAIDIGPYEKPGIPNPPTGIAFTPDITEVEVSWAPSPDIDVLRYAVYADAGVAGDASTLITDTVTRTTCTVTGLADYTEYVISVKGIDEAGQLTAPLTGYVTTLSQYAPVRPVVSVAATVPADDSVTLVWGSSGANATHYIVFKGGDSIAEVSSPDTSVAVTGLQPYTVYAFTVLAVNRATTPQYYSRMSLPLTLRTTDKVAPGVAPANLAQTDSTRTSISLSWTAAADNVGIACYYIYWDGAPIDTTRSNEPVYVRGGLPARTDTSYQIYVVGVDSAGNASAASNTVTVSTGSKADLPIWYVGVWANKPSNRVFSTFGDAQDDITSVTGDTVPSEVWIQAGAYNITATISLDNKAISYYGGFAGYESSLDERAKAPGGKGWEFVNVTKLVRAADVDIMKGSNGRQYGITGDVTIDGISFDGRSEGVNKRAIWVANVYLADGETVKETFKVSIKRCIVEGFGQEGSGAVNGGTDGAIAIRDCNGHGYIDSCLVQNNKGNVGAGIYVADADNCNIRVVSSCYILNNETGTTVSVVTSGRPDITSGAPANWAGGVIANVATIRSCYIAGNKAYGGGGVVFRKDGSKLENCIIVNNEAAYGGGMLFHQAVTKGLITNNTIAENRASVEGGGIYVDENGQQILNNILWKNLNTTQSKIENVGVQAQKTPKLSNNIISENDVYKGLEYIVMPESAPKDTLFDNAAGFEGWHTKLSDSSIVYDRGTLEVTEYEMPTTDYTGAARTVGGRIDVGPFEYQGNPNAPSVPTSLTATDRQETSITIVWGASLEPTGSATLTGYHVYVDRELNATVAAPDTTYTITGLHPWTEYTIQVDAYSSAGESSPKTSELFTAKTTDVTAPSAPAALTVKNVDKDVTNGNFIQVEWNGSNDNVAVTGYSIYVNGNSEGTVGAMTTTYTVAYLEPNTPYTIEVLAFDAAGNESARTAVAATTKPESEETPSAIRSTQAASLQVFPNPVAGGRLVIVNGALKPGEKIAIYATDGSTVKEDNVSGGSQTIVNVAGLKSGLYVVRAGKQAVKIVISE